MLKDDPNYRRLPVTGRSFLGNTTYWLSRTHLLVVEVQGTIEVYRRFELKEVQAMELFPTVVSKVVNSLLLVYLAIVVGIYLVLLGTGGAAGVQSTGLSVAILTLPAVVGLGVSLWAGPSCHLMLKTAVQSTSLRGAERRRNADRLWAELQSAIAFAQAGRENISSAESMSSGVETLPETPEPPAAGEPI